MTEGFKQHLPVIIVVSIVGLATGAFALMYVKNSAASMDVGAFSSYIIIIPCLIMLVCSLVVAMTAHTIGRQLYVTMLALCLALGLVSMVVTSIWMSDPVVSAALLANSPEGEVITPITQQPIIVMRNIAAYVVMPTVGCIAGAWIGSRLHPIQAEGKLSNSKKKKR